MAYYLMLSSGSPITQFDGTLFAGTLFDAILFDDICIDGILFNDNWCPIDCWQFSYVPKHEYETGLPKLMNIG